jgi:hypothetical protein
VLARKKQYASYNDKHDRQHQRWLPMFFVVVLSSNKSGRNATMFSDSDNTSSLCRPACLSCLQLWHSWPHHFINPQVVARMHTSTGQVHQLTTNLDQNIVQNMSKLKQPCIHYRKCPVGLPHTKTCTRPINNSNYLSTVPHAVRPKFINQLKPCIGSAI